MIAHLMFIWEVSCPYLVWQNSYHCVDFSLHNSVRAGQITYQRRPQSRQVIILTNNTSKHQYINLINAHSSRKKHKFPNKNQMHDLQKYFR